MLDPNNIAFQPLNEDDFPLMVEWLSNEAVYRWYGGEPRNLAMVEEKYLPRIQDEHYILPYLILYGSEPIGYIQTYHIAETPQAYRDAIAIPDSAGIDLFIGEDAYRHEGLGPLILRTFMREIVFAILKVNVCVISPTSENNLAIRAYEKAGFRRVKTITSEDGNQEVVMRIERDRLIHSEVIRLRAAVVLIEDRRILLTPYFQDGQLVEWHLPGSGVHYGETLKQAARREVEEETGLLVDIGERLELYELIEPHVPWHSLHIIFAGEIISGDLRAEYHPEFGLKEPCWFSIAELHEVQYHPRNVIDKVFAV